MSLEPYQWDLLNQNVCDLVRSAVEAALSTPRPLDRVEVALRFAAAAASSDIHTSHLQGVPENIVAWGFQLADAFLAEASKPVRAAS